MEFKRISDAELVQVSEETNLIVEVNGEVKRTSSTEYMNEIDGGSRAANLEALKNLAVTLGCAESVEDVASETVAEAIEFISDNYTGGVSSWNDLTDKPFGVEGTTENEILSTFETNYSFDNGIYLHGAPLNIALENGKSYIVKYDSMEYAVTANTKVFEVNGGLSAVCIGDLKLTGESDDNNYPFCFVYVPQYGVCFLCGADENAHTVSVSEVVEQVKQLDPKFVPVSGAGGGSGALIVELDWDNKDVITPYENIKNAVINGQSVMCVDESMSVYHLQNYSLNDNGELNGGYFININPFSGKLFVIDLSYDMSFNYITYEVTMSEYEGK